MTRKPRAPSHSGLTARQKAEYKRSLDLLSDLRRGKGSYSELLRKHRLSTQKAHKYLGRDLLGGGLGKPVRASKADRRVRLLMFPKAVGDIPIPTRSSRDATTLSDYYNDRDNLLGGEMSPEDFEASWRGVKVAGQEVFADAATILRRAHAGDLDLPDLYAPTAGER
jgi:hypothetical protein